MNDQPIEQTPEGPTTAIAPAKPRRMRTRIVTVILGGVVVAGAAFGGGVAVGSATAASNGIHGQLGQGGPGGTSAGTTRGGRPGAAG
jgi:hypothetical protein